VDTETSARLFAEALEYIPGGVNSPVRAMKGVGMPHPLFIARAEGAHIWDVDGNEFVDFVSSWGPMILGWGHPEVVGRLKEQVEMGTSFGAPTALEVELARLICEAMPSVELVRMVNSGTEATMSAVRVARGFTGREKVVKFIGCYHGHSDGFLAAAGSGVLTLALPDSPGVTRGTTADTILVEYNDVQGLDEVFAAEGEQIAAVILEPVAGNMGVVPPQPGFLEACRDLCTRHGAVLVFDEVITGFRVAWGGAQERYSVMPDLVTLGKIIGGGLPVGAFGGRREIMETVAPLGSTYQAGTLSGNPLPWLLARRPCGRSPSRARTSGSNPSGPASRTACARRPQRRAAPSPSTASEPCSRCSSAKARCGASPRPRRPTSPPTPPTGGTCWSAACTSLPRSSRRR